MKVRTLQFAPLRRVYWMAWVPGEGIGTGKMGYHPSADLNIYTCSAPMRYCYETVTPGPCGRHLQPLRRMLPLAAVSSRPAV